MDFSALLLDFLIILVAAKLAGGIAERFGQTAVLGELAAGILIGPAVLGLVDHGEAITILAQLGVIFLLFDVGLQTSLREMMAVGWRSLSVAVIGVVFPFAFGTIALFTLGFSAEVSVFGGAALAATSVGITARVFSDLRQLETSEARTILGAAVIDDVLGLIILTVVVAAVTGQGGGVSLLDVAWIIAQAALFLAAAVAFGVTLLPRLFSLLERHLKIEGVVFTVAMIVALGFSAAAAAIGLAPIVGAFAAGLVIAQDRSHHCQQRLAPLTMIFVPIFFISLGLEIDSFGQFANAPVLVVSGVLTVLAIIGKLLSMAGAIGSTLDKPLIGIGMIPRGEVGLIFASIGLAEGIIGGELYSAVLMVVIVTSFITPPLLKWRLGRMSKTLDNP